MVLAFVKWVFFGVFDNIVTLEKIETVITANNLIREIGDFFNLDASACVSVTFIISYYYFLKKIYFSEKVIDTCVSRN